MTALAIALIVVFLFVVFAYGRAIVYAHSEEYRLDERIKDVTKQ